MLFRSPYFDLRMSLVWHIGSNFLHEIAKNWYQYLLDKGVNFKWNTTVTDIDFNNNCLNFELMDTVMNPLASNYGEQELFTNATPCRYDELIFAVGKSGIDFAQALSDKYQLPTEPKPVQIGVRFEAPQKYFQKLIDISYDFKLYQKIGRAHV